MPITPTSIPADNIVDIWQVITNRDVKDTSALTDILDQAEFARYQKLHHKFQQTYLLSHVACREILASYLNIQANDIVYKKNQYGKPDLDHNQSLKFNMSHSHDMAIIAISNNTEIGVDLEFIKRNSSWKKIARRFFSEPEIHFLFNQPEQHQQTLFFQIWTRKEAFIKALGTGFATALSTFDASNEGIIEVLNSTDNSSTWRSKSLEITPDYQACVVQNTSIEKIRYYSYP